MFECVISLAILVVILITTNIISLITVRRLKAVITKEAREVLMSNSDVLEALEIYAVSSPLAKRLLDISKEPVIKEWRHNTKVSPPSMEHWKLFLRDIALEIDDLSRAVCLDRWLEKNVDFTDHEKVEVASMFKTAEWRDSVRSAFNKNRRQKVSK